MDAATSASLAAGAAALAVPLDEAQLAQFDRYLALLTRWNAQINLTRVIDPAEVVAKHFLDSLAIVPHLGDAPTLVDVGAGAGFPGVPAAIARPGLAVTLVESVHKKVAFLEALKRELRLPLTIVAARLEQWQPPAPFDVAVSRATFAPAEWIARAAPLVAPGGLVIAMLARDRPPLTPPPGFAAARIVDYRLPVEGDRALALLRRTA